MKKLVIKKREVGEVEEIPEDRLVDVSADMEERRTGSIITGSIMIDCRLHLIEERRVGEFAGKAIYLSPNFDWILGEDSEGEVCLVPLKKGEE